MQGAMAWGRPLALPMPGCSDSQRTVHYLHPALQCSAVVPVQCDLSSVHVAQPTRGTRAGGVAAKGWCVQAGRHVGSQATPSRVRLAPLSSFCGIQHLAAPQVQLAGAAPAKLLRPQAGQVWRSGGIIQLAVRVCQPAHCCCCRL